MRVSRPVNLRDLGGIQTEDGHIIESKRLLRSGELTQLTEEEKRMLKEEYNLNLVIDFRTLAEADESPVELPNGVEYKQIDLFENSPESATALSNFERVQTAAHARDFMYTMYEAMASDQSARDQLREFMDIVIGHTEGALLYHCFAGKDRTGVATAIILTLLDVSKENIVKDYLHTNELREDWNNKRVEEARQANASQQAMDVINTVFYVREEYLQHTYDRATELFGSFENYIREGVGITDQQARLLRQNYLK